MTRSLHRIAAFAFVVALTGCASTPSSVSGVSTGQGPQLIFTVTTAGTIDPINYHYYILINNVNDPNGTNGPVPVVTAQQTGGNGFAAGRNPNGGFTHFVRFDSSGTGLYAIDPTDTTLRTFSFAFPLVNASVSGNILRFQIPLADLATAAVPAASINYLQINFVTTNVVPVSPTDTTPKYFDSLGDPTQAGGINSYITIPTNQSRVYEFNAGSGDSGIVEPTGDVARFVGDSYQLVGPVDPTNPVSQQAAALDVTDFRVEVRD